MKKILAFALLVSFVSAAGFIFSGCSGDKKNNVTNGGGTPVYSFEGTWYCIGLHATYNFSGSDFITFGGSGNYSFKGTFEYNETGIFFVYTHRASGNALTGDVTWESYSGMGGWSYSFVNNNNTFIITNDIATYTYIKIS